VEVLSNMKGGFVARASNPSREWSIKMHEIVGMASMVLVGRFHGY